MSEHSVYSRQGHYQELNTKYAVSYKPGQVCIDIYDAETSIVEFSLALTPPLAAQLAARLLNAASMAKEPIHE